MGYRDNTIEYGFGQMGSTFCDTTGAVVPPDGKVIIAITFLAQTTLSGLVADTSQNDAAKVGYFSHTTPVDAVHGTGSDATNNLNKFTTNPTYWDTRNKIQSGLNSCFRELVKEFQIEDIKPAAKSLEEQEEVRIFNPNCGCDKT